MKPNKLFLQVLFTVLALMYFIDMGYGPEAREKPDEPDLEAVERKMTTKATTIQMSMKVC